jgi:hypothetical protein
MANGKPKWPTHENGRPKKMGELTPEEKSAQITSAASTVRAEFEHPAMQQAVSEFLDGTTDAQIKH